MNIETATEDDLLQGLTMTENLYYAELNKHHDDEAQYWIDVHHAIYEELSRRGVPVQPVPEVAKESTVKSW